VIKRITFDPATTDRAAEAPSDVQPVRAAVCIALRDLTDDVPKHDTVVLEWFVDADHLDGYERWLATTDATALDVPTIVADELVLRGADWLDERWRNRGPKLKHMALATRSLDLTAAEFSERWRSHAGGVTRGGTRTPIPDDARGFAYVQNHPRPREGGEWAYDAVNEVYFDDVAGLEQRMAWFRDNVEPGGDELFRASWFLAVREAVVFSAREGE